MREPVRAQARRLVAAGGTLVPGITQCDLLVDGLLGYSARGEPRGGVRDLVIAANRTSVPILAADVPSGVNPDTGTVPGEAIRAVATVTLALPKSGLLAAAAAPCVGQLVLADIGMPAAAFATIGVDTSRVFIDGDLLRVAT
jgi:NAD(P)H-hydrate epimerase